MEYKFIEEVKDETNIKKLQNAVETIISAGHKRDNIIIIKIKKKINNGLLKYENELLEISNTINETSDLQSPILKLSYGIDEGYNIYGNESLKELIKGTFGKINSLRQNHINELLINSEKYIDQQNFQKTYNLLEKTKSKNILLDIKNNNIKAEAAIKIVGENIKLLINELFAELNEENKKVFKNKTYNNKFLKIKHNNIKNQSNNFTKIIELTTQVGDNSYTNIISNVIKTMNENRNYWDNKLIESLEQSKKYKNNNVNILNNILSKIKINDIDDLQHKNIIENELEKVIKEWEEKIDDKVVNIELDNKNYNNYKKLKEIIITALVAGHKSTMNINIWTDFIDDINNNIMDKLNSMVGNSADIKELKNLINISKQIGIDNPSIISQKELNWKKTYNNLTLLKKNILEKEDMVPLLIRETKLASTGEIKNKQVGDLENIINKLEILGVDDSILDNDEMKKGKHILKNNLNIIESRLKEIINISEHDNNKTYVLARELQYANKTIKLSQNNKIYERGFELKNKLLTNIKLQLNNTISDAVKKIKENKNDMGTLQTINSVIKKSLLQGILHDDKNMIIAKKISNHIQNMKTIWLSDTLNIINDASVEMKHLKNKLVKKRIMNRLTNQINLLKIKKINNENSYPEFPNILKKAENVFVKFRGNIEDSEDREIDGLYFYEKPETGDGLDVFVSNSDNENKIKYANYQSYINVLIKCKKGFINIGTRFVKNNEIKTDLEVGESIFFVSIRDEIFVPINDSCIKFKDDATRKTYLIIDKGESKTLSLTTNCVERVYNTMKTKTYKQNYPGFFKRPSSIINDKFDYIMSHKLIDAVSIERNRHTSQFIMEANLGSMGRLARLKAKNL